MKGGFSFCGIDIADIGLEYAPENENTYVYRPSEVNVHEETFDGHDGGYFYGVSRQPKEFILRCYFEETAIDRGLMQKVDSLFRAGKSGKLIFQRQPWCYYYATVTNSPAPELYNYLNGLFTVTMKAYYPYGRCDNPFGNDNNFICLPRNKDYFKVMQNTGMLDDDKYLAGLKTEFTNDIPVNPIKLFNPGTERAPVCIAVAGDTGEVMTIRNDTTGQVCQVKALTKEETTDKSKQILIDSMNGKTVITSDGTTESTGNTQLAFIYHDAGYIDLEPAFPVTRNIFVNYQENTVTTVNALKESYIKKYIFISGKWRKITDQPDNHTLIINESVSTAGSEKTSIVLMNEIIITGSNMDLTSLGFIYKPTFA